MTHKIKAGRTVDFRKACDYPLLSQKCYIVVTDIFYVWYVKVVIADKWSAAVTEILLLVSLPHADFQYISLQSSGTLVAKIYRFN